jgi:hypothetical protein
VLKRSHEYGRAILQKRQNPCCNDRNPCRNSTDGRNLSSERLAGIGFTAEAPTAAVGAHRYTTYSYQSSQSTYVRSRFFGDAPQGYIRCLGRVGHASSLSASSTTIPGYKSSISAHRYHVVGTPKRKGLPSPELISAPRRISRRAAWTRETHGI